MIELYEFPLSGNSHKARLMLSLLGLKYQTHAINGAAREQKTEAFLALNPFGQVPVLKDGDVVVRDSQAILVYLARAYGAEHWLPTDAARMAAVAAWLSTAANEVSRGPGDLRAHFVLGRDINVDNARTVTGNLLAILDTRLQQNTWLATETITIADIAVYPYIALAHQGKIDLAAFPAIGQWLQRIEKLPGYVAMPGIQPVSGSGKAEKT